MTECLACGATTVIARRYPRGSTSDRKRRHVNWEELPVNACTSCGFAWVTEVPRNLDEYYRVEYSQDLGRDKMPSPAAYFADEALWYRPDRARRHADLVRKHTPDLHRLLDVGPGLGNTLALIEGVERLAVEPDETMHPYLHHLGVRILTPDDIPPASVDAVVSSHQLEHLPPTEIRGFLRFIRSVLRPGGTFVAEVPHASLLRLDVSDIRHDPHLSFFTPESLERMVQRAGFESVKLDMGGRKRAPVLAMPLYRPPEGTRYAENRPGPTLVARPVITPAEIRRHQAAHLANRARRQAERQARRGVTVARKVKRRLAAAR